MKQVGSINSKSLYEMLRQREEFALLDVREEGPYYRQHLLAASNLPAARLEIDIGKLVPRLEALIVLCDEDTGIADWAAARLVNLGYTDVRVLSGGISAWAQAGYSLFDGMHVPSKAFGELISEKYLTPSVSADQLHDQLDDSTPPFLIDCRPKSEYAAWNLPGAIDLPGVELAYRFEQLDIPEKQQVVVNCAGRTRSIIATQTLVDLGLGEKVTGLKNGLMGWRLGGYEKKSGDPFTRGAKRPVVDIQLPEVTEQSVKAVAERVDRLADRMGVENLDYDAFMHLRAGWQNRSVYLVDVRTPEEYAAGHHPDAIYAAGGQLVQETDRHLGVRNSVVVLTDDTGVRARLTASWLKRLGWRDVYTFSNIPVDCGDLVDRPQLNQIDAPAVNWIDAEKLRQRVEADEVIVLDLSLSSSHESAHIPGAYYGTRMGIDEQLAKLPGTKDIVLVSEDDSIASLTAQGEHGWGDHSILVLRGGMQSWRGEDMPTTAGMEHPLVQSDDRWWQPERHEGGAAGFMREYLAWEVGLVERVLADGTIIYAEAAGQ